MGAFTDRTGERFISNEGYEFVIVEYNGNADLWVEFQDEHKARVRTTYQCCQKGEIRNPYHPSVFEHCYLGLMSDGSKPKTVDKKGKRTREYSLWHNMAMRVYDPKYHETHPTYKGTILDEQLHCFAYFLEHIHLIPNYEYWLEHPNEYVALDKDIRGKGSKIYSLDIIMFVNASENNRERNERCGNSFGVEPIKVYGVDIKTGEKTGVFDSLNDVERKIGVNQASIGRCLNGKQKTAGGYKWYKVE